MDLILGILIEKERKKEEFEQIPLYAPQPMPPEPPENEKKPNSGGSVTIIGDDEDEDTGIIVIDL